MSALEEITDVPQANWKQGSSPRVARIRLGPMSPLVTGAEAHRLTR
jgi:hypothetical protein